MNRHDFYNILKAHAEKEKGRYTFKVIDLKVACAEIEDAISNSHKHSVMQGPLLWNPYPSVRPTEYGDYFVYRAGKIHKETWNTSNWAYNENTITHWLRISGPTVGNSAAGKGVSVDNGAHSFTEGMGI